VTIGRQSLQILECDSTDKNDAADKNDAPGVRKGKEGAKDCEPDDVRKMTVKPHPRPHQQRRQLIMIEYMNPTWVNVAKARAAIDAQAAMIMNF
jgi:hypothetical protein